MADQDESRSEDRIKKLEDALEDAMAKLRRAEAKLEDQEARLIVLGSGREKTLLELSETRAELERVVAERDKLQGTFDQVEKMQTETVALSEGDESRRDETLPSIDDLMASLSLTDDGRDSALANAQRAEAPSVGLDDSQIMIAPELIAPEEFRSQQASQTPESAAAPLDAAESAAAPLDAAESAAASLDAAAPATPLEAEAPDGTGPMLVFLNGDEPIRYPLNDDVTTIGRAEVADIRIDGDFVSRIHARIVRSEDGISIEDAGSKNGIKVNKKRTERSELHHGDVISIGKLLFTFVNPA